MSVAAVQNLLQSSLGSVEIGPYLTKLCASLATSMIAESRPLAIAVRADMVTVSSHEAVSLGLIVTELVINALKHAFPDNRAGKVEVVYGAGSPGWSLTVSDNGNGRDKAKTTTRGGLGTVIVDSLAKQLGAVVIISDEAPGTRVRLESHSAHTG